MQICGVAFGEVPVEEFGRLGVNLVERERLTTAVNE
jgi:hypothetical protein